MWPVPRDNFWHRAKTFSSQTPYKGNTAKLRIRYGGKDLDVNTIETKTKSEAV